MPTLKKSNLMSKTTRPWSVTEHSRHVHVLSLGAMRAGEERRILLMSDEHWDNAHCDLHLLRRHHMEARQHSAPVLKFGDLFCAMQGKWDRRSDQNQLRNEHRGNNYLDKLVSTAASWYRPFADDIALITPGNHETSIQDRHQTNLTERLHQELSRHSDRTRMGGYWGYVQIEAQDTGGSTRSFQLNYHHGYGGGGEVTRGMIDNNRTRGQYDADVFYSGHIHRRNMDENIVTRLSRLTLQRHKQLFLRGSTYKDEHADGWHAQQGRAARPLGGWWLIVKMTRSGQGGAELDYTAQPAD